MKKFFSKIGSSFLSAYAVILVVYFSSNCDISSWGTLFLKYHIKYLSFPIGLFVKTPPNNSYSLAFLVVLIAINLVFIYFIGWLLGRLYKTKAVLAAVLTVIMGLSVLWVALFVFMAVFKNGCVMY